MIVSLGALKTQPSSGLFFFATCLLRPSYTICLPFLQAQCLWPLSPASQAPLDGPRWLQVAPCPFCGSQALINNLYETSDT